MSVTILLAMSIRDEAAGLELERHLTPLVRAGKIRLWHRGKVLAGQDSDQQWRDQVAEAPIIILLVSADLELDGDGDIADAMAQRAARNARVIPVLWRAVNLSDLRYRDLRMIPDGRPVADRKDRDQAWVEVVQGIRRVVETLDVSDSARPVRTADKTAAPRIQTAPAAPAPMAPQVPEPASPIKILFIGANPSDTARLRLPEERREIDRRIQMGSNRDRFALNDAWAVTAAEFSQTLLRYKPSILHFSGHGGDQGGITFNNETGTSSTVPAPALARLFKLFATKGLRCVVLNACYSATQADALAQHVDCVVGIVGEIEDEAAFAFTAGFYTGLAQGESIQNAFELGCIQLDMLGFASTNQPKLLGKPGVDLGTLRLT